MKSHPLGGCWREKRSPPKMGIKAESVVQGGTPGRSSGANPTPTQHGEPPCALLHPPSTKSSQTGTSPSCSRLVASPRWGIWAKMCFVAPGQGPATGGRSHRGARELAARPAGTVAPLGVQTSCSPHGCASRLLAPPAPQLAPENPWQHLEGQQRGRASRRPRRLITYSRLAPNRFHLESGEARGVKGCPRQRRQAIGI